MFEVGFTEIVLIFAIALLVLGPARLPKLAADVGRWAGRARTMARQLRTQLEQEVHYDPLKDSPKSSQTIHTPPAAPPPTSAAEVTPPAEPDRTDESKPA
jgi:sec-independent protein translocase protein TatB